MNTIYVLIHGSGLAALQVEWLGTVMPGRWWPVNYLTQPSEATPASSGPGSGPARRVLLVSVGGTREIPRLSLATRGKIPASDWLQIRVTSPGPV